MSQSCQHRQQTVTATFSSHLCSFKCTLALGPAPLLQV